MRDALLRTLQAAEIVGIRAVLVHALSPSAKQFYLQAGFTEAPLSPMTMLVTLTDVAGRVRP